MPLNVVFLDFAKAFRPSILWLTPIERKGVDELVQVLTEDSYKGCYTCVRTNAGMTGMIKLPSACVCVCVCVCV